MTVDTTQLETALSSNPTEVGQLFQSLGQSSSNSISYVSSTSQTVPSGSNPYSVEIDQVATQASYTAAAAQTSASTAPETLTFNGALFGNNAYSIQIAQGSTLAATINQINSDGTLKNLVTATNNNGSLMITSNNYGSTANFTVASNLAASSDNSGIGIGAPGTTVTGVDVKGKINGEAATGTGQFLMGNSGNATTSGLQIQYTGSTTGSNVGTISFTSGIGSLISNLVTQWNDSTNGLFTTENQSLTTQYNDLGTQITDLQAQATAQQNDLQTEFANMESAVASLQQQQSQLTSMLNSLNNSSSSSG
jgi:flagellar hook-associated protein 2